MIFFSSGTGKLGFSFVRITSLLLTNDRLWVGTGNGVILSVPLVAARPARDDGDHMTSSPGMGAPGGAVRVYSNEGKDGETAPGTGSFMPYCSMVMYSFEIIINNIDSLKAPRISWRNFFLCPNESPTKTYGILNTMKQKFEICTTDGPFKFASNTL